MWMGHFYYWEGWESPFSYIQVLTLVPDKFWTLSLRQTVAAATARAPRLRSGNGGDLHRVLRDVFRGRRQGWRATGAPVAQYSSVPGFSLSVLRVRFIRAPNASIYEPKSYSPQTKPLPSEVPATAAAKSLPSCPTPCDPIDGSPPGFPSPGFSRHEHWSGLPFPSPMHESEK